ncbi:uncharacterized protein TNCV_3209351 [Trichonephila clavipes]|nr:uncharacterized protein TNCV_3209351 [Trichonephila clavipes]
MDVDVVQKIPVRLCTVSTVRVVQVLWKGAKGSLEDDFRNGQAHRSCHHTGNNCVSECFSLEQPHNYRERDPSVIGYWRGHHSHHNVSTLEFRKMCAQWVPNQRTTEQSNNRIALSLSHQQHYHQEEYGFLSQIVTGDEIWGHHFEPKSKRQSKQWKRTTSPPPKKIKGRAHQFW